MAHPAKDFSYLPATLSSTHVTNEVLSFRKKKEQEPVLFGVKQQHLFPIFALSPYILNMIYWN